mgnify:CR=1 FL=1
MTEQALKEPSFSGKAHILVVTLALTLLAHFAAGTENLVAILPGLGLLFLIVMVGYGLVKIMPGKLPALFWISIVATLVGLPGIPGTAWVIETISALSFVATITPVLAIAALGLRRSDVNTFRQFGLQFVVLAIFVFVGTYLGSALMAQLVLGVID